MAREPTRVVVADELPSAAFEQLRRPGWEIIATFGRPREELTRALAGADALVVRSATRVTSDLIGEAPQLRVIARAGTGVDTIDVDAATERGILVINAPGANTVSVAELTMAFILALARRVPAADASMKAGQWEKKKFTGGEVQGRTLGLVGFGRIGQLVEGDDGVGVDHVLPAGVDFSLHVVHLNDVLQHVAEGQHREPRVESQPP